MLTTSQRSLVIGWLMNRLKGLKSEAQSQNSSGPGLVEEREARRLQVITNKHDCKYLVLVPQESKLLLTEYGLGQRKHTPREGEISYMKVVYCDDTVGSWAIVLSRNKEIFHQN